MPDAPPKYVIECQSCHTSLTIVYSPDEGEKVSEAEVKKHLALLMTTHINNPLGRHGPVPPSAPKQVQDWVRKIRPL